MSLGIKEHLARVSASLITPSTETGEEYSKASLHDFFKIVDVDFSRFNALKGGVFSRFFDIQKKDSNITIPGATALHVPFPETKPVTAAYIEWLQANIKKFAPLFNDMSEGSIYQQVLATVIETRDYSELSDLERNSVRQAIASDFEAAWKEGWLRNAIFVAFLTHMTSTVTQDPAVRARDSNLPPFEMLRLLIERPNLAALVPFSASNATIEDGLGNLAQMVGDQESWANSLVVGALGSPTLLGVVPMEDLGRFGEEFRNLRDARKIAYLLDYLKSQTDPWAEEKLESVLAYIKEIAEKQGGTYAVGVYAETLNYIATMKGITPEFNKQVKQELIPKIVAELLNSGGDPLAKLNAIGSSLQMIKTQMQDTSSQLYQNFQNTGWTVFAPTINIAGQNITVSSELKAMVEPLQVELQRLQRVVADMKPDLMANIEEVLQNLTDTFARSSRPQAEKMDLHRQALVHFHEQRTADGTVHLTQAILIELESKYPILKTLYPDGLQFDEYGRLKMFKTPEVSASMEDEAALSARSEEEFSDTASRASTPTIVHSDGEGEPDSDDDFASVGSGNASLADSNVSTYAEATQNVVKASPEEIIAAELASLRKVVNLLKQEGKPLKEIQAFVRDSRDAVRSLLAEMGEEAVKLFDQAFRADMELLTLAKGSILKSGPSVPVATGFSVSEFPKVDPIPRFLIQVKNAYIAGEFDRATAVAEIDRFRKWCKEQGWPRDKADSLIDRLPILSQIYFKDPAVVADIEPKERKTWFASESEAKLLAYDVREKDLSQGVYKTAGVFAQEVLDSVTGIKEVVREPVKDTAYRKPGYPGHNIHEPVPV